MPLSKRRIESWASLAPSEAIRSERAMGVYKGAPGDVLQDVCVQRLMGVLRQLGALARQSGEIFDELLAEVDQTGNAISSLQSQMEEVEKSIDALDAGKGCKIRKRSQRKRGPTQHDLFLKATRPAAIQKRYDSCNPAPQLDTLDDFSTSGSCLKKYTNSDLFLEEWLTSEEAKLQKMSSTRRSLAASAEHPFGQTSESRTGKSKSIPQPLPLKVIKQEHRDGDDRDEDDDLIEEAVKFDDDAGTFDIDEAFNDQQSALSPSVSCPGHGFEEAFGFDEIQDGIESADGNDGFGEINDDVQEEERKPDLSDPAYEKYRKMLKQGLNREAIAQALVKEGLKSDAFFAEEARIETALIVEEVLSPKRVAVDRIKPSEPATFPLTAPNENYFLSAIKNGRQLRKVDPKEIESRKQEKSADSMSSILSAIKAKNVMLKKVKTTTSEDRKKNGDLNKLTGVAAILAKRVELVACLDVGNEEDFIDSGSSDWDDE